ncbi:MAG: hypothetical protein R3F60_24185 [bacterium]
MSAPAARRRRACGDGLGDATDDDCDGVVDQRGCVCPEGQPCDTGLDRACAAGTTRCEGGRRCAATATAPSGAMAAMTAMAWPTRTGPRWAAPCPDGLGACAGRGTWACAGDAEVRGLRRLRGERCNGVDDDCDGTTDEGFEGSTPPARPARAPARATACLRCTRMAWAWPATPAARPRRGELVQWHRR